MKKGPLFAQIILADEINRAPAKVQAALLEAMQEHQVTIGGVTFPLEEPFLVLATQNPIENEGTYPLPEAQLDRFMLKVRVGYPSRDEEKEVLLRMSGGKEIPVERLLHPGRFLRPGRRSPGSTWTRRWWTTSSISCAPRAIRESSGSTISSRSWRSARSPRASIALAQAARAHAFLRGRAYVVPEDVRALAPDVLRHRIVLTFEAEAEDTTSDDVVTKVLGALKVP